MYAHCVGFGQDGPYAELQAYDDVIQAASGTATLLPRVDGNPRARYLPSLIADKVAGLHGAYGVLAAIIHKMRTGKGQRLEIPMFETFTNFMLVEHLAGQIGRATSELQSLMRISYAVFCLKKKNHNNVTSLDNVDRLSV